MAHQHETRPAIRTCTSTLLLPNKQPRADGTLVAVDSDSLWHEAKAAGTIYQAPMRRARHRLLGHEWTKTDPHTGMAELAAVRRAPSNGGRNAPPSCVQWAADNLVLADGEASAAQLAAAQKPTRPRKQPEGTAWAQLRRLWRDDPRKFSLDPTAKRSRTTAPTRTGPAWCGIPRRDARTAAAMADRIDKPAFTPG